MHIPHLLGVRSMVPHKNMKNISIIIYLHLHPSTHIKIKNAYVLNFRYYGQKSKTAGEDHLVTSFVPVLYVGCEAIPFFRLNKMTDSMSELQ